MTKKINAGVEIGLDLHHLLDQKTMYGIQYIKPGYWHWCKWCGILSLMHQLVVDEENTVGDLCWLIPVI